MPAAGSQGILGGVGYFHSQVVCVNAPYPDLGAVLGSAGDEKRAVGRPGHKCNTIRMAFQRLAVTACQRLLSQQSQQLLRTNHFWFDSE